MKRHSTAAQRRPAPGRARPGMLVRRAATGLLTCLSILGVARGAALVTSAAVSLSAAPETARASWQDVSKEYWQKRYRELASLVTSLEQELENKRSAYTRNRHNRRLGGEAKSDLLAQIADLEKQLAKAERELQEFPEAARKAGALPGWFRDL